ncbi:hypothetical protein TOPH_01500 [Tolypocladium ophioglossoides CBS 100239]|uniref:magnesium chelatase n=1 Tax=Tolypocladium ophioglossoides (strain CBS 100239) TaxID=1163406 RepID=A0A0L0NIE6_TOLOC|nr:hypothetical protein TOPH_01500 [Tolypocladium ophioglossoides CBS 100239]
MADDTLLDKVHDLSDLELAILLCLVSREHGMLSTPADAIDDLIQELLLVASQTLGLKCAVVDCTPDTTLEDFASGLLSTPKPPASSPSLPTRPDSYFVSSPQRPPRGSISPLTVAPSPSQIANCVLAKNLDRAPRAVQIQALELLRTRRIFTRTSVQTAPKQFVFVPVLEAESGGEAHVTAHLNDFFSIAHWHDPEDGFVNLEEMDGGEADDRASTGSVVRSKHLDDVTSKPPLISETEISQLALLSQQVQVDVDVVRYQMNIVSFLRMHRAVAQGITPAATKHFDKLMRCLAPLHKLDYVTPALVGLAARKVYLHRIRITAPEKERSMQWGSKLEAVEAILEDVGPEEVIEDVLEMVTAPL